MGLIFTNSDLKEVSEEVAKYKPLNRNHGFLLCVIVHGIIGAHSVKWLDSINIIAKLCQGDQGRR